ncbi:hypothetical protein JZ751_027998 [Albula glossodonta]|uniref:PDZ domain-containing protein n=1 Tax=Albula glossodonta TaxID=121402 RepID=A0A8T2PED3_9TELE|nr:hypothetical protein JZ751_027998 [Albula glossodonta]
MRLAHSSTATFLQTPLHCRGQGGPALAAPHRTGNRASLNQRLSQRLPQPAVCQHCCSTLLRLPLEGWGGSEGPYTSSLSFTHPLEVTKKRFGSSNFRSALENGVLLLINKLKPGIVKRVNRLSTPIAGLDNINVFLKACGKLGLKEAQLFHPGDLQDLSSRVTVKQEETNRRLKNALEDSSGSKANVRDSGFGDSWYTEKEELFSLHSSHKREDSLDSLDSVESRTLSISSDATLKGSSEGCGSDAEAELGFKMTESKDSLHYRRSLVVEPRVSTQFNQFLPTKDKQTGYVPAPLRKKRAERHEDNRRSWASPMYTEEDGTFTRLFQKRSGYDGSKSMSDIPVDPAVLRQVRYEELQKIRAQARESEDQWQDDLTKWKNRRRSVNSDIVKKKEEREQIESITSGGSTRKSKTFKEMQEERESREQGAPTRYNSSLYSSSQDVFSEPTVTPQPLPRPQPRARTLPPRSHTVDSLYTTTDGAVSPPVPPVQEERSPAQALEPDHITSTLRPRSPSPAKTGTTRASPTIREEPEEIGPNLIELTSVVSNNRTETVLAPDTAPAPAPAPTPTLSEQPSRTCSNITPAFMSKPVDSSAIPKAISKAPEFKSPFSRAVEEQSSSSVYKSNSMDTKPGPARVSASLPRSYQRTESARLPSVVTPRPFGTQSTRISSLPRTFAMDDSHKRLNGETDSQKSSAPSRYSQFMTEEEKRAQVSPALSSNEDEEEEEEEEQKQPLGETPATQSSSDALKPKKETTLVSAPESEDMQELFSDMRICLNQKPNSSQGFGFQTNWDSTGASIRSIQEGSPAELCQLRVGDEVLAVSGHKVSNMTYEQWKGAMDDALQKGCLVMDIRRHGKNSSPEKYINTCSEFNLQSSESTVKAPITSSQPVNDLESKDMNGGFREESVTMRNKGGSESAISDVPSISTSSNRWSWDSEDERRRQEKWQKEQERLLQEKYKRDQEKLDEEFRRAQQEATKEVSKYQELALPPSLDDPTQHEEEQCQQSELEERKRRERQEQLQREERERQRRAEEMRQQRMREEEEAERRRLEEEERRRQEAAEEQRQEHERMQQQW